ncbi:MAG: NB-ARC domain-containing protein [Ktedonobacteraceae bacterium]
MVQKQFGACPEWEEHLAAYPEELSSAEHAALMDHLKKCEHCTLAFADYRQIESFAQALRASDPLLESLFAIEEPQDVSMAPSLPHLPVRQDTLVGRETEIAHVLEGLRSPHVVVSIEGMGGIGKTALAIEVVYQCLQGSELLANPLFEFASWFSARGRLEQERPVTHSWLEEILDTIARSLDYPFVRHMERTEKRTHIEQLLSTHHTLLVIDNFETIADPEVLTWIQQIPLPSRVLITSSDHPLEQAWSMRLEGLTGDDALHLIRHHARELKLRQIEYAGMQDVMPLVAITKGNPQAIHMVLGYVKSGRQSLQKILAELDTDQASLASRNVCDRLYARSWTLLEKNAEARATLLAMAFFRDAVTPAALGAAAGLTEQQGAQAIARLVDLSLIRVREKPGSQERRYTIHPLTRAFIRAQIDEDHTGWEQKARERWVAWYLAFTRRYGGLDGQDWAQQYELIEEEWENIRAVMEWCELRKQYQELKAFWQNETLLNMTSIYGYHWKERINWLRRLQHAAQAHGDESEQTKALTEQGFTLTQMGRVEEAQRVLEDAWTLHPSAEPEVQITLAENLAQLFIRRGRTKEAEDFLMKAKSWLEHDAPHLSDLERFHHSITITYYHGVIAIEKGKREQAEQHFMEMRTAAHIIGWQRAELYAQEFLADIAKAQGKFAEAQERLEEGLMIAEQNKERRRAAYYRRSLAFLVYQRGRRGRKEQAIEQTITWAQEAREGFIRLGMQPEVTRLEHFLNLLTRARSEQPVQPEPTEEYSSPLRLAL